MPTVVWSYPRGEDISKDGETAIDVDAYATQIAALLGAHIIKVKLPTAYVDAKDIAELYKAGNVKLDTLADRVAHIRKAARGGRRIVIFSGGGKKSDEEWLDEARAIKAAGGQGSITGRNTFQRSKADAMALLDKVIEIYKS